MTKQFTIKFSLFLPQLLLKLFLLYATCRIVNFGKWRLDNYYFSSIIIYVKMYLSRSNSFLNLRKCRKGAEKILNFLWYPKVCLKCEVTNTTVVSHRCSNDSDKTKMINYLFFSYNLYKICTALTLNTFILDVAYIENLY